MKHLKIYFLLIYLLLWEIWQRFCLMFLTTESKKSCICFIHYKAILWFCKITWPWFFRKRYTSKSLTDELFLHYLLNDDGSVISLLENNEEDKGNSDRGKCKKIFALEMKLSLMEVIKTGIKIQVGVIAITRS